MRTKLLPMLFVLIFVLAACGSNQGQASPQAVTQAPTCQSTIPVGQTASSSGTTSAQPVVPGHMQMGPHMRMTSYRQIEHV